jgi:hypothetical protein
MSGLTGWGQIFLLVAVAAFLVGLLGRKRP